MRGYLAAQVIRGRTHISWVWDVYDDDKLRALRITGEEAGGRGGGDPWSVADEPMLRRIARASMDRLAAYLGNPGGAARAGRIDCHRGYARTGAAGQATAPPASAAAPSAAERLAMSRPLSRFAQFLLTA